MKISSDKINEIAVDGFVSTSGKYFCVLAEAYAPANRFGAGFATLRRYDFIALSETGELLKIVALGSDRKEAMEQWESIKQDMTAPFKGKEEPKDDWQEMPFANHKFTEKEAEMLKTRPADIQIIVRDIVPIDEVSARAEAAGLAVVVSDSNKPPVTMGLILKVGAALSENFIPGNVVVFGRHSGSIMMENGQAYRILMEHEVVAHRYAEDGFEDLNMRDEDIRDIGEMLTFRPAKIGPISA